MKKAVILAAGSGTRMQPATLFTNKHLLPLYSNNGAVPMIMYPIQTLINSGITEILIITSKEHCGPIVEHLSDGSQFGVDFTYKIQDVNHVHMGIASALQLAKNFTNDERFAVILGDNFFAESFKDKFIEFEKSNMKAHIFLKEVEDIKRFGCATMKNNKVTQIVEKPTSPESNLAVTGLYLYTPDVYNILPTLTVSQRNELEISDLNNMYVKYNMMSASILNSMWSDMGTPTSIKRTQEYIRKTNYKITL